MCMHHFKVPDALDQSILMLDTLLPKAWFSQHILEGYTDESSMKTTSWILLVWLIPDIVSMIIRPCERPSIPQTFYIQLLTGKILYIGWVIFHLHCLSRIWIILTLFWVLKIMGSLMGMWVYIEGLFTLSREMGRAKFLVRAVIFKLWRGNHG